MVSRGQLQAEVGDWNTVDRDVSFADLLQREPADISEYRLHHMMDMGFGNFLGSMLQGKAHDEALRWLTYIACDAMIGPTFFDIFPSELLLVLGPSVGSARLLQALAHNAPLGCGEVVMHSGGAGRGCVLPSSVAFVTAVLEPLLSFEEETVSVALDALSTFMRDCSLPREARAGICKDLRVGEALQAIAAFCRQEERLTVQLEQVAISGVILHLKVENLLPPHNSALWSAAALACLQVRQALLPLLASSLAEGLSRPTQDYEDGVRRVKLCDQLARSGWRRLPSAALENLQEFIDDEVMGADARGILAAVSPFQVRPA